MRLPDGGVGPQRRRLGLHPPGVQPLPPLHLPRHPRQDTQLAHEGQDGRCEKKIINLLLFISLTEKQFKFTVFFIDSSSR